jgi:hypothetical protein
MILYRDCLLPILVHAKGKLFTRGKCTRGTRFTIRKSAPKPATGRRPRQRMYFDAYNVTTLPNHTNGKPYCLSTGYKFLSIPQHYRTISISVGLLKDHSKLKKIPTFDDNRDSGAWLRLTVWPDSLDNHHKAQDI